MQNIISELIFYLAGIAVAAFLFQPSKTWKKGYDDAKSIYNDWDKGFDAGWKAAKKRFTDYEQGFKDGYHGTEDD